MSDPQDVQEHSRRLRQSLERSEREQRTEGLAQQLCDRIVTNVGRPKAREMMRRLMGGKKPGPKQTDEDLALTYFIYGNILHFGKFLVDGKIARLILENNPCYLKFKSGALFMANDLITEETFDTRDDPIVGREPLRISPSALKKRVERVRRWAIEEGSLSKEYAPRLYCRD
jgi:hypothetical protein